MLPFSNPSCFNWYIYPIYFIKVFEFLFLSFDFVFHFSVILFSPFTVLFSLIVSMFCGFFFNFILLISFSGLKVLSCILALLMPVFECYQLQMFFETLLCFIFKCVLFQRIQNFKTFIFSENNQSKTWQQRWQKKRRLVLKPGVCR